MLGFPERAPQRVGPEPHDNRPGPRGRGAAAGRRLRDPTRSGGPRARAGGAGPPGVPGEAVFTGTLRAGAGGRGLGTHTLGPRARVAELESPAVRVGDGMGTLAPSLTVGTWGPGRPRPHRGAGRRREAVPGRYPRTYHGHWAGGGCGPGQGLRAHRRQPAPPTSGSPGLNLPGLPAPAPGPRNAHARRVRGPGPAGSRSFSA